MKYTLLIMAVILFCQVGYSEEARTSGKCTVKEARFYDDKDVHVFKIKTEEVLLTGRIYGSKFGNSFVIQAKPWITNLKGKDFVLSYSVALYHDEKETNSRNLVLTISQSSHIPADANGYQFGSALQKVPRSLMEKITSFDAVIYFDWEEASDSDMEVMLKKARPKR